MTDTDILGGVTGSRADAQRREAEAETRLAAIRAQAAARTGWQPWMTEEAGWGGLGEGYAEILEAQDARRDRYGRLEQGCGAQEARDEH